MRPLASFARRPTQYGVVLDPGKNICGDAIAAVPGCTTYRDVMEGFSSLNKVWKDASGATGKSADFLVSYR